ncbi:sulfite exporter TauE/SafE family protein [Candidatus Synechococcus calcipolaris G9]|uniref:Probable membrane transporter protein n=1 Tax=Candidatus Synechococcus calcipolaris G9 TaxID=1497997 RepID=A0ABT6F0V6_9SYNE|nr:sulfite exporter TauE/SafE family protein [Candidatus Synechococcus calcipolaris]MDG2991491.1 sulfite exporter TauE/SafE family protein [Candidatus Synechococcus calcipolaris G9]
MTWILLLGGLIAGLLSGLLGIGGGSIMVPLLVSQGFAPVAAVGTSTLTIALIAISGTVQNARMGYFDWRKVLGLGVPSIFTAQLGAYLANRLPAANLLFAFGVMLLVNIYLMYLRRQLITQIGVAGPQDAIESQQQQGIGKMSIRLLTGGAAGLLAGLFGVGGGIIMVPLQVLFLAEPIKTAIQTSLGVIIMTAIAASLGHFWAGSVVVSAGLLLAVGGIIAAQASARLLPRLGDRAVMVLFNGLILILAGYTFYQAGQMS